MNQLAKWAVLLGFIVCFTSTAWGKGPQGVKNTLHDFSLGSGPSTLGYWSDNLDEICAFCHTPHGGVLTGPLWNHSMPAADSFTHYNSATLSTQIVNDNRPVNDESLLCMACHDGSVAVDHLLNSPATTNGEPISFGFSSDRGVTIKAQSAEIPWARIGTKPGIVDGTGMLDDDHPISFSYTAVYGDTKYSAGGSHDGELNLYTDAELAGVRFFGANQNVECSSCHDPHVSVNVFPPTNPEYRPFLIMPNTGSDLCLACHNK